MSFPISSGLLDAPELSACAIMFLRLKNPSIRFTRQPCVFPSSSSPKCSTRAFLPQASRQTSLRPVTPNNELISPPRILFSLKIKSSYMSLDRSPLQNAQMLSNRACGSKPTPSEEEHRAALSTRSRASVSIVLRHARVANLRGRRSNRPVDLTTSLAYSFAMTLTYSSNVAANNRVAAFAAEIRTIGFPLIGRSKASTNALIESNSCLKSSVIAEYLVATIVTVQSIYPS